MQSKFVPSSSVSIQSKERFATLVALAYAFPFLFWTLSVLEARSVSAGLFPLSVGYLMICAGTLCAYLAAKNLCVIPEKPKVQDTGVETLEAFAHRKRDTSDPEAARIAKEKIEALEQEIESQKQIAEKKLLDKGQLIQELERQLEQQQRILVEKEDILGKLHAKVHELTYEIKTVVPRNVQDKEWSQASSTSHEQILRRCLSYATQNSSLFSPEGRMGHLSDINIDRFALDQRRFFQLLGKERTAVVFVLSSQEDKLLYVNSRTKELLGILPEHFSAKFLSAMKQSASSLQEIRKVLQSDPTCSLPLSLNADPSHAPLVTHFGLIQDGSFKNHLVAVVGSTP